MQPDQIALESLKTFADFGMKLAAIIVAIMGWLIANKDTRAFLQEHKGMSWTIGATTTVAVISHTIGMGFYLHFGIAPNSAMRSFFWPANICHGTINLLLILGMILTLYFISKKRRICFE